jgi:hypothetical protein
MPVYDIDAPGGVVRFARIFVRRRLKGFKKDMQVCLKPGAPEKEERAFMPMLTNTIALLELFSGLHSGHLRRRNQTHLTDYLKAFGPREYDDYLLTLLYVAFRHKLAHLSHPHVGLNTVKEDSLKSRPMRLAWSITADPRDEPITLTKLPRSRQPRWPTPWKVTVDHKVEISVHTLAEDVIKSTAKYLAALKTNQDLRDKFRRCMKDFYQT